MSKISTERKICSVCGLEHKFEVLLSTNSTGYMDLDTRPAPMARYTLAYDVEICPSCYFANFRINELPREGVKDIIKSPEYNAIVCNDDIDPVAKKMILAAKFYEGREERVAGLLYLRAAWVYDDSHNQAEAIKYRKLASYCLNKHIEKNADVNAAVMLVDIQRRTGLFNDAIDLANDILEYGVEGLVDKILHFEIKLCEKADANCYTVGDVIGSAE